MDEEATTESTRPVVASPVVIRFESPLPWRQRAGCRGLGPAEFYADEGTAELARAGLVCRSCAVAIECLGDALTVPIGMRRYGMRAGHPGKDLVLLRLPPPRARRAFQGDLPGAAGAPASWVAGLSADE